MTIYSGYNPAGTTRTSKRGIARHVPLLPNHFNHRWFDAYVDDFLDKNVLENDGVVSGCVISQDGGNDSINITSGEVYISGSKVTFTSSGSPFVCPTDGWYIAYINDSGAVTYGLLENEGAQGVQGSLTPDDSVVVGFAVRGNGVFYITSFFNEVIPDIKENIYGLNGNAKNIRPTTGIIIPLYIYPTDIYNNSTYNGIIDLIKVYDGVPITIILNPSSGPGSSTDGNFTQAILRLRAAGATVIGYISTNYTAQTELQVQSDVNAWLSLYPDIDGIFYDEMTNSDNQTFRDYYISIKDYAHKLDLFPVVSNPGSLVGRKYYDQKTADLIISYENASAPTESELKGDFIDGHSDYSKFLRGGLVHSQSSFDPALFRMIIQYLGFVYITNDTISNPWDTISPYFEDMLNILSTDGEAEHVHPIITVGPSLQNSRVTDLEATFVSSLSEGDKILFISGVTLTATRTLTTEVEVWMDGPDEKLDLDTFDLTFVEVSGKITVTTSTGKIILNGRTHGLIIIGSVVVEQGPNFSGTYSKDGELFYENQIIPTSSPLVWGTSTQVTNLDANFYTDAAGAPLDKTASAYTLSDDDEILVNHNATLAANLKLQPVSSKILQIGMAKGVTLNLGDAGSGVPFKFEVGNNIDTGSGIDVRGTFKFDETDIAIADKRIVNNRAYGVKIKYNNIAIFDPAFAGDMVFKDTEAFNPYLIPYLGEQFDWLDDGSNTNKTLLRDLNRVLQGLVFDGAGYVETRSRFSLPAIAAYKFQVNKGFGFLRQLAVDDPDIHSRTDINGVSVADTATFSNGSSTVTFNSMTNIKNGMRINGADARGVPDETESVAALGTTILKDVDTTALTATMIDALTGADIHTTATITVGTIAVTMDNSGAAGGSKQIDAFQGHWHLNTNGVIADISATTVGTVPGRFVNGGESGQFAIPPNSIFTDGDNGAPRKTSQTYPISTGTIFYQRA